MKYQQKTYAYTNHFIPLPRRIPGVLYEPLEMDERGSVGIVVMHSDENYLNSVIAKALAEHGFRALAANVGESKKPLDDKLLDVKAAVDYLKSTDGIRSVLVLGHSGGATMMSAYQAVAENGNAIFQDDRKIVPLSDIEPLSAADAVMFLDSNWGNGTMTLVSIDPSVTDEGNGTCLDPAYDLYAPGNGYDPAGAAYPQEFRRRFLRAQARRSNAIIDYALERKRLIEEGRGRFIDDEPLVIPGGSQTAPNNRLFPQDIHLLSHTKNAWPLLHADGSMTQEIVYCRRRPRGKRSMTPSYKSGSERTSVMTYLTSSSVRATGDLWIDETGITGIDWDSSYCCTPSNIPYIHVPTLIMGMTGSYEYLAAELLYERSGSTDKTIAFVEGASHNFTPARDAERYEGEFGDTVKVCYDYVAQWICEKLL